MDLSKARFAKAPCHPDGWWGFVKMRIRRALGFEAIDGAPQRCTRCLSTRMQERTWAMDGGYVSESATACGRCGKELGYWAYGYWEVR